MTVLTLPADGMSAGAFHCETGTAPSLPSSRSASETFSASESPSAVPNVGYDWNCRFT